jgi:hypothetical protein
VTVDLVQKGLAFRSLQKVPGFGISGRLSKKIWVVVTWCVSLLLNLVWLLQDSNINQSNVTIDYVRILHQAAYLAVS